MAEIETRRIPIWRTFWRIQWHVIAGWVLPPGEFNVMIPKPHATLQGAATGRIQ